MSHFRMLHVDPNDSDSSASWVPSSDENDYINQRASSLQDDQEMMEAPTSPPISEAPMRSRSSSDAWGSSYGQPSIPPAAATHELSQSTVQSVHNAVVSEYHDRRHQPPISKNKRKYNKKTVSLRSRSRFCRVQRSGRVSYQPRLLRV